MKKTQKLIGLALVAMFISVQLIPIINVKAQEFAIETYGENPDGIRSDLVTNKAKLTVTSFYNEDEFSAYKIIDVFYNRDTNEITYDFTSQFRTFLDQTENYGQTFTIDRYFELTGDYPNGTVSSSVITTSTLNVLVSKYTTYIRENDIKSSYDLVTSDTGTWDSATEEVVAGAYLILPSKINTTNTTTTDNTSTTHRSMYGVMVGNVIFSSNQGIWYLPDRNVYVKLAEGRLSSFFVNTSTKQYTDYINGLDVGNLSLNYYPSINSYSNKKNVYIFDFWGSNFNFPTNAINKQATYTIEIPDGVDFDNENVFTLHNLGDPLNKVVDGKLIENGLEVGTISFDNKKIVIAMNPGSDVTLVLDVWLNDKAVIGDAGNVIKATSIVTDDPYVENSTTDLELENIIYTYGLELTSLSKDDSVLLKGAKYEIYANYDNSVLSNKTGEFTVGDDGKATFAGVPSGTIYLKQIKAPTGYQLIKEPIAVKIATEGATASTQEGYYQVITYNDAMWYLPSTGGIGTIIYTMIGLLVIAIASFGVVYYRKKNYK